MDWKKLACALAISGGLVVTGCGDDDGVDPPPMTDGGTEDPDTGPPPTATCERGDDVATYVVAQLHIEGAEGTTADGFNLDGVVSTADDADGCFQDDFTSPDGMPGVDNQLAALIPALASLLDEPLADIVAEQIENGTILILAELEDYNGTADDDCVNMNLLLGTLPEGVEAPELAAGGGLAGGQMFDVNPESFQGGEPLIRVEGAEVSGGTLEAGPVALNIAFPFNEEVTINLMIEEATISFDIGETTLSNGVIGGQVNIEELLAIVGQVTDEVDPETIRGIVGPFADLDPDDENECQALSVGLKFDGVDATFDGTPPQ